MRKLAAAGQIELERDSAGRIKGARNVASESVEALARKLMDDHGLTDWTLRFNNGRYYLGTCNGDTKTITISRLHIEHDTTKELTDTILHEIAHALAPKHANHGKEWKAICRQIGAHPKSCKKDGTKIPPKWEVTCSGCSKVIRCNTRMQYQPHRCAPGVVWLWRNTETGETWDGKPKRPKFMNTWACTKCGVRCLFKPPVEHPCICRNRRKVKWTREKVPLLAA